MNHRSDNVARDIHDLFRRECPMLYGWIVAALKRGHPPERLKRQIERECGRAPIIAHAARVTIDYLVAQRARRAA